MASIQIMQLAYQELDASGNLDELPLLVKDEMTAVHSLLSCEQGEYMLQALKCVAEFLDDSIPFDNDKARQHRNQTVSRLKLLLKDGAEELLRRHPYNNSVHLMVLLDVPPKSRQNSTSWLEKLLSSKVDPNVRWKLSPLHLAAQERNKIAYDLLIRYHADATIRDEHGLLPIDYEKQQSPTNKAQQSHLERNEVKLAPVAEE
ncbi:hypothetical protein NM208_g4589 [Fusarium decemcellulare]|uniref:Uncharacterized protein n=1 Tax=Fusarium decemcellulare TaxID=57161 RepID=A0ACC1SK93_9HYPO|nr:hypothetical protein NM208_g4589 [Fusarium decemcellulare]